MKEYWQGQIKTMIQVKQDLEKYDQEGLYEQYRPENGATEEEIRIVERSLGFTLDEQYRDFLKHANGWKNFNHTIPLFGTTQLFDLGLMGYVNKLLNECWEEIEETIGFTKDELLSIAATSENTDVFLISKPSTRQSGVVIWIAGYEIERYKDFKDFFSAMIIYNREDVEYFKSLE